MFTWYSNGFSIFFFSAHQSIHIYIVCVDVTTMVEKVLRFQILSTIIEFDHVTRQRKTNDPNLIGCYSPLTVAYIFDWRYSLDIPNTTTRIILLYLSNVLFIKYFTELYNVKYKANTSWTNRPRSRGILLFSLRAIILLCRC